MGLLSGETLKTMIAEGKLKVEPFDPKKIQPASYDCSLGSIIEAGEGRVSLSEGQDFTLQSNTWACIASREVFNLPIGIAARYGIPSSLARRGIIAFGGPQIDPGYRGKLFVSVYNPTLEPVNLRFGQDFFTVIFETVDGENQTGYSGTYQDQTDFPAADVEMMMRMRSKNLSDVIDRVETLDDSVTGLAEDMRLLNDTVKGIKGDVHEMKTIFSSYTPYAKVFFWVIVVAAGAVIGDYAIEAARSIASAPPAPPAP